MTASTHMVGGVLFGQAAVLAFPGLAPTAAAFVLLGSVAGSLLPDLDHPNSKASRTSITTRITSTILSTLFRHRGPVHTPILLAGLVLLLLPFASTGGGTVGWLLLGLGAGMLSHLVLDSLNPHGIMWLWPITKKRFRLLRISTGSWGERFVMAALSLAVLVLASSRLLPVLPAQLLKLLHLT